MDHDLIVKNWGLRVRLSGSEFHFHHLKSGDVIPSDVIPQVFPGQNKDDNNMYFIGLLWMLNELIRQLEQSQTMQALNKYELLSWLLFMKTFIVIPK